jgi:hypothetical protein
MAFDWARERVVLFGGIGPGGFVSDTWEWDGTDWIQRFPAISPPATEQLAMTYDLARGRLVLFDSGGTWEYGPTSPAGYSAFGLGCVGSAGTPALESVSGRRPWLGENFTVAVSQIPANAPALVWLGSSKTSWGPILLPFALDHVGMTGCTLLASPQLLFVPRYSGGAASLTLPVPNDPSLLGGAFFNQALVVDPPANRFGATVSNACEGKIGSK